MDIIDFKEGNKWEVLFFKDIWKLVVLMTITKSLQNQVFIRIPVLLIFHNKERDGN